jgi:hypothetical protein
MLWKNLIFLAFIVWVSGHMAEARVVSENVDDALHQRYEGQHATSNPHRGVAAQKGVPAPRREPELANPPGYWKMNVPEVKLQGTELE